MGSCSNTELDPFLFEYKFSVFMLSKFKSTFANLLMETSCYLYLTEYFFLLTNFFFLFGAFIAL